MGRLVQRDVLRERMDRGEPCIPGPIAIAPDALEMVEKVADKRRREILKRQRRGRATQPLGREPQEEPERVTVARHRVGAGLSLLAQAIGEEVLQQRGKAGGRHRRSSPAAPATRAAAQGSNSGTASRYQYASLTRTGPRKVAHL